MIVPPPHTRPPRQEARPPDSCPLRPLFFFSPRDQTVDHMAAAATSTNRTRSPPAQAAAEAAGCWEDTHIIIVVLMMMITLQHATHTNSLFLSQNSATCVCVCVCVCVMRKGTHTHRVYKQQHINHVADLPTPHSQENKSDHHQCSMCHATQISIPYLLL